MEYRIVYFSSWCTILPLSLPVFWQLVCPALLLLLLLLFFLLLHHCVSLAKFSLWSVPLAACFCFWSLQNVLYVLPALCILHLCLKVNFFLYNLKIAPSKLLLWCDLRWEVRNHRFLNLLIYFSLFNSILFYLCLTKSQQFPEWANTTEQTKQIPVSSSTSAPNVICFL